MTFSVQTCRGVPSTPTWARGDGIPVVKTELVEGNRIVMTLEDGSKVMAEIVDIWRP